MEISHRLNPLKSLRSYDDRDDDFIQIYPLLSRIEDIMYLIRQASGNRMDYRDFEYFSDSMNIVPHIWRYIELINDNKNDIEIEHISNIRQYWLEFRNFLPLVFKFPDEYMENDSDNRVIDSFKTLIVSTIVDKEDTYDEQLNKLNNWSREVSKIENFVNFHNYSSILQDNDVKDLNIMRILKTYILALNQVIEQDYGKDTFEYTEMLLSIY